MQMDITIAWRNIWRNPRRTILTVSAIAFACLILVFMLSFQFGAYSTMINASVKIHTGHLQVQAQGYQEQKKIRKVVPRPEAVGRLLAQNPAVEAATYRANAFALISSAQRTIGALVVGIDAAKEARVSTLPTLIRQGRYLKPGDENQALVGEHLAHNLKLKPGDELTVLGQGRDGSVAATILTVAGIYRSGIDEIDRSTLHMPLKDFQEIFSMAEAVHEVVVTGRVLKAVGRIKKWLQEAIHGDANLNGLAVLDWTEIMPGLLQSIQIDLVSGVIMYAILILVVAFSIFNTFLMAILERTREFGVLMAIGTTPRRLMFLVLMESICLTLVGIIAGMVLGVIVTLIFQTYGIDLGSANKILAQFGISGRMYPRLTPLSTFLGPGAVFLITVVAALYPAIKVTRLKPVEAMTAI